MKRLFDFMLSLFAIIVLSIPILTVAIIVRISIGSPVFFRQMRPGLHEKPFNINKFRTMTNETDSNGVLLSNEKRITSMGNIIRKLSLDELPQLFNVLKGDMSFVGPRPLLMEYLPLYNSKQNKRHNVRPGITGMAQINGRNNISWEERFELDVWYVENRTFMLDLKIICLTIMKVFKKADVNPEDKAFVEKFKGSNTDDTN